MAVADTAGSSEVLTGNRTPCYNYEVPLRPADPANEWSGPEPEPLTFEQERAQRRRRRLLWGVPVLITVLVASGFSAQPAFHAIKAWQARRLADRSLAAADAGRLMEAADQARDALQIYRAEPEVWRAFGRLFSRIDQGRQAVMWWQKVEQAGRLTAEDRRDWVGAALAADAPAQAKTQLDWLLAQKGGGTPADLLLAAQDAVWHHNPEGAESFDRRVLAAAAASRVERFHAAFQILCLTTPTAEATALAHAEIVKAAKSGTDPLAREALVLLATRALAGSEFPDMPPAEIAAALDAHPQANPVDHLLALAVSARANPAQTDDRVAEALRRFGGSTDNKVVAILAEWLSRLGRNEAVLQILDPARAARSPELARTYLDVLAAAGRWSEARGVLDEKRLPLDPMSSEMYLAVVRGHLGELDGSAREWDRALDAAGKDPGKLLALGIFAAQRGAESVADSALGSAIAAAPAWREPYITRYQFALAHGQTAAAKDIMTDILRRWPGDPVIGDEELYLRLLLDPGVATADATEDEATSRLAGDPANWQLKINVALARLRQERGTAALAALTGREAGANDLPRDLDPTAPARAQVVYAAALAASGERGKAGVEARRLNSLSMLPEERALIAPLVTVGAQPEPSSFDQRLR